MARLEFLKFLEQIIYSKQSLSGFLFRNFGNSQKKTQNEKTEIAPASPYAATKAYSYWITKIYRESYKLFACNGILFNHESPYRGETFVTRK